MLKPSFGEIEELFREIILPFYEIERDISVPIKKRRLENDAEHSWSLAFMASVLASEIDPTLDVGKVCQFAVVHDLVEVYAGDTSTMRGDHSTKVEREAKALKTISDKFSHFSWITRTIKGYESKKSDEAKFVYAMDKFLNMLIMYADNNLHNLELGLTKTDFDKVITTHREKAYKHPAVIKYYDQLLSWFDAHPELFHPEAKGRDTAPV